MIQTDKIDYQDEETVLKGFYAMPTTSPKKPVVLVVHDWSGRNEFAEKKAIQLAELGYIGFAIDMFGGGKQGTTKEEKSALIQPLVNNRLTLRQRILAALKATEELPNADTTRIAAMGFCFGGLCVLDLARSGATIRGVVSFHGLLNAPENLPNQKIQTKVLAIHGHDDPMVTPEHVLLFQQEMTQHNVDWQMHIYGGTMHAFTNPLANDPDFGTVYKKIADERSWLALKNFLAEVIGV